MRIHIVEDDFGVRDALTELVSAFGFAARAYADGESFLRAGPPGPSDIVFVDLGLPGISGSDVIRWLATQARAPRVVAISGKPRADIDAMLRELPSTPLLRKPLEADAIAAYL
ncbi:response regulator [Salinarimonas rosea]|uniref:response regulator n=1 Tax=Salinarimonas rosea TaxID=552063 RepID=UPI00041F79C4|nr:response regulator [Salinarimonas rosea]